MKYLEGLILISIISLSFSMEPKEYMDKIRKSIVTPEPSDARTTKAGVDYGTIKSITYSSKAAGRNKKANVLLPGGYNENEKYPVLYINHGLFGSENDMLNKDFGIQTMAGNYAANGEAEKMIIVFPNVFTSKTRAVPSMEFTEQINQEYDAFLEDITDSLIPYIEEHFSVQSDRDHRAISGFSMGAREAIYIGISRPDLFGYIGGACPAPGIVPAKDQFMTHKGTMTEDEFRIKDLDNLPYVLFITGGTSDTVVGDFPKEYSDLFTKNGVDNIFQSVPGADHDANAIRPHFYNFIRSLFKAHKE